MLLFAKFGLTASSMRRIFQTTCHMTQIWPSELSAVDQYQVTEHQASNQIGGSGIAQLYQLQDWLYKLQTPIKYRVAPSIIARTEAELFGISSPRFAYRAYFADKAIINCRRLKRFVASVTTHLALSNNKRHAVDYVKRELDSTESSGFCVADALLSPPNSLSHCHVLTTDLGLAYGEGKPFSGTPFLQHLRFGLGLCGQSVCFMTLALLQRHATNIYGVAELAALAAERRTHRTGQSLQDLSVPISGLAADSVEDILTSDAGLNAYAQFFRLNTFSDGLHTKESAALIQTFLRAYLLSGYPVIQKVDLRGFFPIIAKNKVPIPIDEEELLLSGHMPHAVVVVGCTVDTKPCQYVVNDPASFPFLVASQSDLAAARNYKDLKRPFGFITATHKDVKLPLLEVLSGKGDVLV